MGSLKSSKTTPKSSHFNSGRTRTRPCIYCGAFFFDFEKLRRHEETEAERFREEREKIQRQKPTPTQAPAEFRMRERLAGPAHHQHHHHVRQHHHQHNHHVRQQAPATVTFYRIDRTVEEFGEDWEEDQIYPPFYHSRIMKTKYRHRQLSSQLTNNNNNNNNHDKLHQSPSVLASLACLNPVRPRPQQEQDFQSLGENSWITFEPTRMPKMPESKIVVKSQLEEYLHKLNEEEWVKFIKQQLEPSPAPAPVEAEDPNRMDCRHCGLLFTEVHVRKFHEESHRVERDEREELSCGYCGQMFSSLAHKKIHETAHQSLEEPGAAPSQAEYDCRLCGRKFMLEAELVDHNKLVCTLSQPAKPVVTPSRPRLADQEGWTEDHQTLPPGWKMRSRPRATQAGQLFFIFLSPDHKVFHSRKKVMEHMERLGGYSQSHFDKVREGSKNPRKSVGAGRKPENAVEEEEPEEEPASSEKPKTKRKNEECAPKKKAASKETHSEDEEKENKTDVKTKRSKRSRKSFQ